MKEVNIEEKRRSHQLSERKSHFFIEILIERKRSCIIILKKLRLLPGVNE
jgi:hypothetical protein